MTKWDYTVVELVNYYDDDTYRARFAKELDERGTEVWEFTLAVSSREKKNGQTNLLVFK